MNNSYYAVIPATVRYDKDLPFGAKMLYGEITALSNQRGYCFAQNAYFANLYDLSISTISRWVSKLVKKGYLKIEIVYKDGTKAVEERRLYINDTPISSAHTPKQNLQGAQCKSEVEPLCKNAQDNNTRINTTLNKREKGRSFVKPTVEEIKDYCRERGNNIDPQRFYDFYESKGWMVGKTKMKDWKASIRTWENRQKEETPTAQGAIRQREYTNQDFDSVLDELPFDET